MERFSIQPIENKDLEYQLDVNNPKNLSEQFLVIYHLRDSILSDLLSSDINHDLVKEKIRIMKALPIPDNLSLVPLTAD